MAFHTKEMWSSALNVGRIRKNRSTDFDILVHTFISSVKHGLSAVNGCVGDEVLWEISSPLENT